MDGTLLSSIAAVERVWTVWAQRHGIDPASFIPTMHGRRAVETIGRLNLPGIDVDHEVRLLTEAEMADVGGIAQIDGAVDFLAALPPDRWAIVTSAKRELALRRIEATALLLPQILITADDVSAGKPAPDGFLLAARRLGAAPEDCVVFEDAVPGVRSAEAAGTAVVVIGSAERLGVKHPSIANYRGLSLRTDPSGWMELRKTDPPA